MLSFKILRGGSCLKHEDLETITYCTKLPRDIYKTYLRSFHQKYNVILKFSRFFDFFLIFFRIKSKIMFGQIWPLKLWNRGLTLMNFIFSVFLNFIWAYFRKNQSTFFSKNDYSKSALKFGKKCTAILRNAKKCPLKNFGPILKLNLGDDWFVSQNSAIEIKNVHCKS